MIAKSERMKTKKSHLSPKFFRPSPTFGFSHWFFKRLVPSPYSFSRKFPIPPSFRNRGTICYEGWRNLVKRRFTVKNISLKKVNLSDALPFHRKKIKNFHLRNMNYLLNSTCESWDNRFSIKWKNIQNNPETSFK